MEACGTVRGASLGGHYPTACLHGRAIPPCHWHDGPCHHGRLPAAAIRRAALLTCPPRMRPASSAVKTSEPGCGSGCAPLLDAPLPATSAAIPGAVQALLGPDPLHAADCRGVTEAHVASRQPLAVRDWNACRLGSCLFPLKNECRAAMVH